MMRSMLSKVAKKLLSPYPALSKASFQIDVSITFEYSDVRVSQNKMGQLTGNEIYLEIMIN